ncbi:MAG: hypothetical protein U9N86_17500, partial [Bacteroidota bacterium]|nr:hypothetical protein [Bacteroidota bacterium]
MTKTTQYLLLSILLALAFLSCNIGLLVAVFAESTRIGLIAVPENGYLGLAGLSEYLTADLGVGN